jgi:hypothetical protein
MLAYEVELFSRRKTDQNEPGNNAVSRSQAAPWQQIAEEDR